MEKLVSQAEARGVARSQIAGETLFVSHETYTPARGGSAAAEIHALRQVFGGAADQIVIANTKGYTGHPMGVGLEDVMAVKSLETGVVPPVPNFRDPDPELGVLNLSQGGAYPVRYALRLAAGFGSQIVMLLMRWVPTADGRRRAVNELGYSYRVADPAAWARWLKAASQQEAPRLEVAQHRLRVVDQGAPNGAARPVTAPAGAGRRAPRRSPGPPPVVAPTRRRAAAAAPAPASVPEPAAPRPCPSRPRLRPAPAVDDGSIEARVLEVVAEQTGYPTDLLDMDLDLEADLGIDTVKQAEVFASIRESYGIERDDALKLRDYPTLNHVVGFVRDRAPGAAAAVAAPAAPAPEPRPSRGRPVPSACRRRSRRIGLGCREETGYPTDLLDGSGSRGGSGDRTSSRRRCSDRSREADGVSDGSARYGSGSGGDLGIDTVKQAEVFASIRESYGIERDDALKLRDYPTLNHVVGFVRDRAPGAAAAVAAPAAPAPAPAAAPPVRSRLRQRRQPHAGRLGGRRRRGSGVARSSLSRRGIRRICSTWTWISRPTWGSTRSSRPRCSRGFVRPTGSSATTS